MSSQTPGRGLAGKRAVVTGGASGIGLATACRLAAEGVQVMVFDRNRQALNQVLDGKTALAGGVYVDVSDPEEVASAYEQVDARMGGIDILVARTMSLELAPKVRVKAVFPGYVLTAMQQAESTPELLEKVNSEHPLAR